jgi:hypothetical protein
MMKIFSAFSGQRQADKQAQMYRDLIRREAEIGGQLFGPVQKGGRREFFCLNARTWVWHEEWIDQNGQRRTITTRYDIRPTGILKAQDGHPYQPITREEGLRIRQAAALYLERVKAEIYDHYN